MPFIDGEDAVSGDCFGFQEANALKNHYRGLAPTDPAAGLIESDDSDDKLYHYINDSGGREEILQATKSDDVTPVFDNLILDVDTDAISDPPTEAELQGVFGSSPGDGFIGFLQATDSAAKTYLIFYFAGTYYYQELTAAI